MSSEKHEKEERKEEIWVIETFFNSHLLYKNYEEISKYTDKLKENSNSLPDFYFKAKDEPEHLDLAIEIKTLTHEDFRFTRSEKVKELKPFLFEVGDMRFCIKFGNNPYLYLAKADPKQLTKCWKELKKELDKYKEYKDSFINANKEFIIEWLKNILEGYIQNCWGKVVRVKDDRLKSAISIKVYAMQLWHSVNEEIGFFKKWFEKNITNDRNKIGKKFDNLKNIKEKNKDTKPYLKLLLLAMESPFPSFSEEIYKVLNEFNYPHLLANKGRNYYLLINLSEKNEALQNHDWKRLIESIINPDIEIIKL